MKIEKIRIGNYKIPLFEILTAEGCEWINKTGAKNDKGKYGLRFSSELDKATPKPHIFHSDVIIAVSDDELQIKKIIADICKQKGWL